MKTPITLLLLFLSGCAYQVSTVSNPTILQVTKQSLVTIAPMEDCTLDKHAPHTTSLITESLQKRINQKGQLALTSVKSSQKQFLVTLQLLQYGTHSTDPSELNIHILLKILDMRFDKPQELYQEMITYNTLLNGPLPKEDELDWNSPGFRVGPLGLALAKLVREVSSRIEDYIQMAIRDDCTTTLTGGMRDF